MHPILKARIDSWPGEIVPRNQIAVFTGNLMKSSYIANLDSKGLGPERLKIGRKVVYPIKSLCAWLDARLTKQG